jgi:hypothetical protein
VPTPTDLATLADLGWATLFLGIVVTGSWALHRGHWVPGWVYRAERDRRIKAESALEELVERTIRRSLRDARREHADPEPPPGDH